MNQPDSPMLSLAMSPWEAFLEVWHYELTNVDGQPLTLHKIVVAIVVIVFGVYFSKYATRSIGRRLLPRLGVGRGTEAVLETVTLYLLIAFVIVFALSLANVPIAMFAVLGGALAIGVGFGSQNVVNNFISGIIIMLEQPIKPGDVVEVEGTFGRVESIGLRSTLIRTPNNTHIVVPNSAFLEKNVLNWTLSDETIRTAVTVGIAYGSPTREAQRLIHEAVKDQEKVLKTPEPVVLFTGFGDNALEFEVVFWLKLQEIIDRRVVESEVRYRIDELFREAGIVIAFPQRDLHIDNDRPLEIRVLGSGSS